MQSIHPGILFFGVIALAIVVFVLVVTWFSEKAEGKK